MSVYRPKGTDRYVYDFWIANKRYCGPCDTIERTAAKRVERAKKAAIEAGLKPDAASEMTIDAAAQLWYEEAGQHLKAAVHYARSLDVLIECVDARTRLKDIDGPFLTGAISKRRLVLSEFRSKKGVITRPPKNSTINRQILDITRRILHRAATNWGAKSLQTINWARRASERFQTPNMRSWRRRRDARTGLISAHSSAPTGCG